MNDDIRSDISHERNRAWYAIPTRRTTCPNCGQSLLDLARLHFNMGFDNGARWAIRRSTQLSPQIASFVELITWLFAGDADRIVNEQTGEVLDTYKEKPSTVWDKKETITLGEPWMPC